MLACGEYIRRACIDASSVKQESRGFSHVRFNGIGEYKLFARLRDIGILFKNENGDNVPYEKPIHKGKFTACPAIAPNGEAHLQTRVYPEGIAYITKKLRKHGYLQTA